MAIKVGALKKGIVDKGQYEGRVCTKMVLGNGIAYGENTLLTKIVDAGLKLVMISGDFTANVDILTVIKDLNSWGYKVIFDTDSWDEVWPMVRFKNLILSVEINIPTEWEPVNYLSHITTYFREKDEMRFKINDKQDYNKFREFQKTKSISAPMKILEVSKEYKNTFEVILKDDLASMDNLIIKYI